MISESTPLRTLRRLQEMSLEEQKNSPSASTVDLTVRRQFASTASSGSTTPLSASPMIPDRQIASTVISASSPTPSPMIPDPFQAFGHSPLQEYQKVLPAEPIKEENHLIEEGQIKAVIRTVS